MYKLPYELHPDLTLDRIRDIVTIICYARADCLNYHNRTSGDTNWSYGCRAREWTRQALRVAVSDKNKYPYLSILEDNGQNFTIGICDIPIKFFKDDSENPDQRVRKISSKELAQLSLFDFGGISDSQNIVWRILVETNPLDLEVIKVVFVALDQNEDTLCLHDVPLQSSVTKVYDTDIHHEEAVELTSPKVSSKTKKESVKGVVNE